MIKIFNSPSQMGWVKFGDEIVKWGPGFGLILTLGSSMDEWGSQGWTNWGVVPFVVWRW